MKFFLYAFLFLLSINVTAQNWKNNLDQAKSIAKEEGKQILLVFSGSDWCAPCIKLEKKIWSSQTFQDYAENNLVLLRADFPKLKKNKPSKEQQDHNKKLAEKYNTKGYFPFVVLVDAEGEILNQLGYKNVDPQAYIKSINAY